MVLAFMSHSYVWGGDKPAERVPPSISIPFTATCNRLELPLVATYAGVVLWNYKPLFPDEPIDNLENLSTLSTFTGSIDESWFYLVSVAIEARGAPIVPLMLHAIEAARYNNADVVVECLRSFAERLDELGALLQRMYDQCDPHVFYHRIRPFLAGSKNMGDAGLPNGVIFDTGNSDDNYVQYSGGSNAQSSIIQFFDLVLGVEHRPQGQTAKNSNPHSAPSTHNTDPSAPAPTLSGPPANFIHDMRTYMPGPHARFLEHVSTIANIRSYVTSHRHNRALANAFDACLAMLRAFRDKHIQMVSRYIIVKSRESRERSNLTSHSTSPPPQSKLNIANRKASANGEKGSLRGTGGTALIPFLKQARDETGEPAIDAWARRLLNNGPGTGHGGVRLGKIGEHASGEMEIVGLAGVWSVDDSDGGICHW